MVLPSAYAIIAKFICVCALFVSSASFAAEHIENSQECIPQIQNQQPWRCSFESWERIHATDIECTLPKPHILEPIWQTFDSREDVYVLLRQKYTAFGNVLLFSNWLNCQGFNVWPSLPSDPSQISDLGINYLRKNIIPYQVPWYDPQGWLGIYDSEAFVVTLDQWGQITKIETWHRN